jgi:hypothetical protein
VAEKRDLAATRQFFTHALEYGPSPTEVTTDRAPTYPRVLDELLPAACHVTEQYTNNPIEADHGRLKSRLRPMRGFTRLCSARVISAGHAFVQNLRRGHSEFGMDLDPKRRLPHDLDDLFGTHSPPQHPGDHRSMIGPPPTPTRRLVGQQRLQPRPLFLSQIMTTVHRNDLPHPSQKIHGTRPNRQPGA